MATVAISTYNTNNNTISNTIIIMVIIMEWNGMIRGP
jgi:hypothetical protein